MRMLAGIAVAAGAVAVAAVAIAGIATAAEPDPVGDPVAAVQTPTPAESLAPSDASDGDGGVDDSAGGTGGGLECVLVPVEGGESAAAEGEAPAGSGHSIPAEGIECSGTGNERSAEVAVLPRYLAHSGELSGAERGAAISEWAKTHANRKTEEAGGEPVVDEGGASGDAVVVPSMSDHVPPAPPGRSGDAPGRSDSRPGEGRGR